MIKKNKIKIGITGSTGVLGKILTKSLKKKYKVVCFRSDIRKISKVRKWIKNNKFDAIFHLASLVPVKACEKNPYKACEINIGGTKNILDSINKVEKKPWFFYSSTSHVYKFKKNKIIETDKTKPISFYGHTKLKGEQYILKNKIMYKP